MAYPLRPASLVAMENNGQEDPSGGQNRIHRGPWLWQSLPGAEQGVTWPPKEQGGHAEQDFTCSPFSLFLNGSSFCSLTMSNPSLILRTLEQKTCLIVKGRRTTGSLREKPARMTPWLHAQETGIFSVCGGRV